MDNETPEAGDAALPRARPFSLANAGDAAPASTASSLVTAKAGAAVDTGDRAGIFRQLVKDDGDIAGLVAYSIYKQNKLDWLRAFESKTGHRPSEQELGAYIIGEGTPRRIATYRHLAEATLAGGGPDVDVTGGGHATRRIASAATTKTLTNGLLVTYGLIAVLFVIVLWFAAHFTAPSH